MLHNFVKRTANKFVAYFDCHFYIVLITYSLMEVGFSRNGTSAINADLSNFERFLEELTFIRIGRVVFV